MPKVQNSSSISLRKRKTSGNKNELHLSKEKISWSLQEKTALLNGLKKYGFGKLEDIAKEIKTKSLEQVRQHCKNRKNILSRKTEITKDPMQNVKEWKNKIGDSTHPNARSAVQYGSFSLSEVLQSAEVECLKLNENLIITEDEQLMSSIPDFGSIYKYFSNLLTKELASPIGPIESFLTMHLIQDLLGIFRTETFQEEKSFLQNITSRSILEELTDKFSANGTETMYPKVLLEKHPHKFLITELNPMQIPLDFFSQGQELISSILAKRENLNT